MILLNDEEIRGIGNKTDHYKDYFSSNNYELNIAKAQVKKFRDIIRRDYPETLFLLEDLAFWHELLEEVKE